MDIDGEAAGDQSGSSVSLGADGTVIATGARYNNGNGTNAGHVRVFSLNPDTDDSSTVLGTGSGGNITTGIQNVFVGDYSGFNNTSGSENTFVGQQSGLNNTSGSANTFVGQQSGLNTTALGNTAVGHNALAANVTGNVNVAIGTEAGPAPGSTNLANTIAIGYQASVSASNQVAYR